MNKILIIGQALPNQEQKVPYDTTMLYDWFEEIGITKDKAQDMFLFDAVYNKFPGYNESGKGHKVPSFSQMVEYYNESLKQKIQDAERIIVLGNHAKEFLTGVSSIHDKGNNVLYLMHPSRMNFNRYKDNKVQIINSLREFILFED